jgi:hypothetical protein
MVNDPGSERQRLDHLYRSLTDGELLKLAREEEGLTDIARSVLWEEMSRRELSAGSATERSASWDEVAGRTLDSEGEVNLRRLVAIRQFRDMPEALLAKGLLESAGIECFFGDDNIVRLDWFISNLVGGVKLLVKPEDAAIAHEILESPSGPFIVEDNS